MLNKVGSGLNNSEFRKIYRKEIVPTLHKQEKVRKKKARKYIYCYIFFMTLLTVCLFILFWEVGLFESDRVSSVILFLSASLCACVLVWVPICKCEKRYIVELKKNCLPVILKYFGDISWCNNEKIISNGELNQSGLFANYNRRIVDDEFKGSYNGVKFKICETNMCYESGSGKSRMVIPVFQGIIFSFDLNKTIQNRTIVSTKGDLTQKNTYWIYILPFLFPLVQIMMQAFEGISIITVFSIILILCVCVFLYLLMRKKQTKPLDKVYLEDPKFNSKFDVYSSDQIEARFWVTPAFMERFQNLKTVFNAKKAKCSFYDNKIMIAIDTNKNVFEIGELYKSLENPETIRTFCKEVSSINELIDYFKIHELVEL